ncbi:MAG TPA: Do family serine endopeptidase [Acidiferrobacterales bacterium]
MQPVRSLMFVAQMITLGLAMAFIAVLIWPELIRREPAAVEIIEAPAAAASPPASGPVSYAQAVERAAPAVVNINTAKVVTERRHPLFNDPVFRQFFGELDTFGRPRQRLQTSLGSGVIFSDQGYILTNHHVIHGADAIEVYLRDGRSAKALLIGSDPDTDVAVLKIDLPRLPAITLGQSDRIRIGDVVLAIGNPFGVGQTVTMGIVSATGRNQLGINTFENFIQTDAAINPGNSGGALVDAHGNLIGINTAIFSRTGGSQGIGFAIPSALAREVMEQIVQHGRPLRGWLGVEAQSLTAEIVQALGLDIKPEGLVVTGIVRNSPAHRAGLEPGDVILSIDGKKLNNAREMLISIAGRKPGDTLRMQVVRAGKTLNLEATAAERPAQPAGR